MAHLTTENGTGAELFSFINSLFYMITERLSMMISIPSAFDFFTRDLFVNLDAEIRVLSSLSAELV